MRLLVVEDDQTLNQQIVTALEQAGYAVDRAYDGEEGQFLGETEPYDAIILDLGLPRVDGVSVLNAWRREGRKVPVIILTARDRWSDKVQGFDAGADDYVTKPFHMEELLARVRALLRRATGHATSEITCGSVRLDTRSGRVVVDGNPVKLTSHEYRLLSYLMHHTGRIVSRGELTEHLYEQDFDRDSNTIEVFIGRLRKKLGVDIIQTVRGLGYLIDFDADRGVIRALPVLNRVAGRSIAVRLAVSAAFWSFAILLIAGITLSTLYREATEQSFDQRLLVYANNLAADLVAAGDTDDELGSVGDPRFELPLSGWYWQVTRPGGPPKEARSSKSLFGAALPSLVTSAEERRFGEIRRGYGLAPDDRRLRMVERDIDLGEDGRFIIRVGGPADEIADAVHTFRLALLITFGLLGLALGFTALLQIRFGLQPLANLRSSLGAIRRGEAERIPGEYPRDIAPVASELNLLLESNREILERARTQVGNLAHALKTPLSVMLNEAEGAPPEVAARIREQAAIMRDQVNYYLDRARAAALAGTLGTMTEVEPVIAGLARTFIKIYRDKNLVVDLAVPAGTRFRGERQDLEEMAGNLIDNASKWATGRVVVSAEVRRMEDRSSLRLLIEDDGPGLPEEARAEMLKRGRRLDETKPGSGLGLSIVSDLATLYRGSLTLEAGSLGGLRAVLELPGDAS